MKIVIPLLVWLSVVFTGMTTGSLVETRDMETKPEKITLAWTMDSLGSVVVTSQVVRGELSRVVAVPGTYNWTNTITLKDTSLVDLLYGKGSMVTGVTYNWIPGTLVVTTTGVTNLVTPVSVNDKLLLSITSGGTNNAKTGTLILYVK